MYRIGHGYDVHKFAENRKLIIGGVEIPYEKGLLGHSDADVLVHAICDSLLGAAALGDIGTHFPDTDPRYKNIDSRILLSDVCKLLNDDEYEICNIDATVVAQKPKLAEYINSMRFCISFACGIDVTQVNIKATTEEGLGFTGDLLGIAAHSVSMIKKTTVV